MNNTKKSIFDSAIKVFSEKGYSRATMDDIALNAGVAKGTLYYHFKSKEEIFNYIISDGMKFITEEIEKAASKETMYLAKLKVLCKVELNLVYEKRDFFKVILSQLWGKEVRQLELRDAVSEYVSYIENYIKKAIEEGSIRKGKTSLMAYNFFGTLCSAAAYELINEERAGTDEIIEYIFNGISK